MNSQNVTLSQTRAKRPRKAAWPIHPAICQAAGRLRDLFGDQHFQRTPQRVAPTPRAEALWDEIREPLAAIRAQIAPDTFAPTMAMGELRLNGNSLKRSIQIVEQRQTGRAGSERLSPSGCGQAETKPTEGCRSGGQAASKTAPAKAIWLNRRLPLPYRQIQAAQQNQRRGSSPA